MAYLHSQATATSNGEYGRGGSGSIQLHWHNMPDATVELLPAEDTRGDIEIRWHLDPDWEGALADLTLTEARTLRDKLTAAIVRFEGIPNSGVIDNEVGDAAPVNVDGTVLTPQSDLVRCRRCNGRIMLVFNGNDYWWTHEPFSINDHEPIQAQAVPCGLCGGAIELLDNGIDIWWVHDTHPADGHQATPVRTAVVPEIGEVA
ncbi:hypothetical protein ACWELJ_07060 [Nocardia sp. NPDC004582]